MQQLYISIVNLCSNQAKNCMLSFLNYSGFFQGKAKSLPILIDQLSLLFSSLLTASKKKKRDKNLSTKSIAIIGVRKTNRQVKYVYRKYSKETVSK